MSHIKSMIAIQAVTRAKVLKVLGLTELQYGNYLMAQALQYLENQLGVNTLNKELAESSLFWAWWRNHWHTIDMEFVEECKSMSQAEANMYYEIMHDLEAFQFTPQRAILQDAFKNKPIIKHQL